MSKPAKGTQALHAWREPDRDVRLQVDGWLVQSAIGGQYIERARSVRVVWEYLRRIGPVAVWRKVVSRLAEAKRNRKVAGIGIGRILESPPDSQFSIGQPVVFFAPNNSPDANILSLDECVIVAGRTTGEAAAMLSAELPAKLRPYVGWSKYSGRELNPDIVREELEKFAHHARRVDPESLPEFRAVERREVPMPAAARPTAVIFGLGNYAKTQIVPNIRRYLKLAAVHEVDPDQLAAVVDTDVTLDTSPVPREGESYDAWFIAGFHHTHAPLAIQALNQGAYAVVEKPLVTTRSQFNELRCLIDENGASRMFSCFHKRYSKLNQWVWQDLNVDSKPAVDMHCLVYEIPLPALHWYNWPNSGSRLISNGCHWLDYFMFVNHYSPVSSADVARLRGSDLVAWVTLENGAQMVMSLTDAGSERLGVRDLIELRSGNTTVRIIDASDYFSENSRRVLRRSRINPLDAYARMYSSICERIAAGAPGDAVSTLRSTDLMLKLEDKFQSC